MTEAAQVLDAAVLRRWVAAALASLEAARAEIDELNVYPVADSDTGTNLVRTVRAGAAGLAVDPGSTLDDASEALATAALRGAAGNSGTIVSQVLRGVADAAHGRAALDGAALAQALSRSAALARSALSRPVEGTILTVADAAADAAADAVREAVAGGVADVSATATLEAVTSAAHHAAAQALAATPAQLPALGGRVDAGGRGLVILLAALDAVVAGRDGPGAPAAAAPSAPAAALLAVSIQSGPPAASAPHHEVMYLLDVEGDDAAGRVAELRVALDGIGDSVVVVGGNGLWQVHAHVADVGAAIEAGLVAGRPHQVRVTALPAPAPPPQAERAPGTHAGVLALVGGPGLADLLRAAGAQVLDPEGEPSLEGHLLETVEALPGLTVVVLPGSVEALAAADSAARSCERMRVVRSHSVVQVMAALAVHDGGRDPARDLLEMATAAAGCRDGLVEVAQGEGLTSAGWCHGGDVLGHVDGDVAIVGADLLDVAVRVVDLLLGGGGEMVTLVSGAPAEPDLAARVAGAVRARRPDVDVHTYDGGQTGAHLLVGVE